MSGPKPRTQTIFPFCRTYIAVWPQSSSGRARSMSGLALGFGPFTGFQPTLLPVPNGPWMRGMATSPIASSPAALTPSFMSWVLAFIRALPEAVPAVCAIGDQGTAPATTGVASRAVRHAGGARRSGPADLEDLPLRNRRGHVGGHIQRDELKPLIRRQPRRAGDGRTVGQATPCQLGVQDPAVAPLRLQHRRVAGGLRDRVVDPADLVLELHIVQRGRPRVGDRHGGRVLAVPLHLDEPRDGGVPGVVPEPDDHALGGDLLSRGVRRLLVAVAGLACTVSWSETCRPATPPDACCVVCATSWARSL